MIIAILLLIAAILLFGRGAVLAVIICAVLWGVSNFAHAGATYSYTNKPVTVMCPNPGMTALLESLSERDRLSAKWQYVGGHAHCATVKSDRALIIMRAGSVSFRGRDVEVAEVYPAGVITTVDGFSGPYYLLTSRIAKLPSHEQMRENAAAFLPTAVQYKTDDGLDMHWQTPPQIPVPGASGR